MKAYLAEFLGTFWLVLGGCGSAMISAGFPEVGIGLVGVSLAFGLSVLTIAYSLGHVSGAHLNPAVKVGLVTARKLKVEEMLNSIFAQVLGAFAASAVLYYIATGNPAFQAGGGFATNGYGTRSPGGYSLASCFV